MAAKDHDIKGMSGRAIRERQQRRAEEAMVAKMDAWRDGNRKNKRVSEYRRNKTDIKEDNKKDRRAGG